MSRLGNFVHIIRFVSLILLQGLIIKDLDLGRQIHPMIHILFIMLLPIEWSSWLVMLIGFVYGLCVDTFTSTIGMHISACVFLAAIRPLVLRLLSPREGYEFGASPSIAQLGIRWFIAYAAILTLVHHLWYFYIEVFSFNDFFDTFLRAVLSALASLILIVLAQFLFGINSNRT